ncbi:MAG: integration host factor subunit beta [Candidatus Sumerlaeia bacterium]|nr:integration host factor subunit beta [Candidatus Sumerlaeia bacterium]
MIKAHIVRRIAKEMNWKDKDALRIVDQIIEALKEVIVRDRRLEIRDFGVFQIKTRKPRVGRNPKNKKEYPIPPRSVITFKPGRIIKAHSVGSAAAPHSKE